MWDHLNISLQTELQLYFIWRRGRPWTFFFFFLINWRIVVSLANLFTKMNLSDFHSEKLFLNDPNLIILLYTISRGLVMSISLLVLVTSPPVPTCVFDSLFFLNFKRMGKTIIVGVNTQVHFSCSWIQFCSWSILYAKLHLNTEWIVVSCSVPDMANLKWQWTSSSSTLLPLPSFTGKVSRTLSQHLHGDLSIIVSLLETFFSLFTMQ